MQALLATLEEGLGDHFTDDVKAAWKAVYGVVSSTMIAGAEYEDGNKASDAYPVEAASEAA